jgi:hypothetical protein
VTHGGALMGIISDMGEVWNMNGMYIYILYIYISYIYMYDPWEFSWTCAVSMEYELKYQKFNV